ncbi:hypothetical protein FJU08_21685 [Martelella alba]|uniref:Uncharacterized protein n=1 Tax=Martelella alba TaxID=2590451 RepID=A0A506TZ17_9HYPH|nr:hypothetical protein FJU08_21685 [Martelella alba]
MLLDQNGYSKLQVAHIKLAHSRAFLLRVYLLQTHEMLFDAHWHGFRVFGGITLPSSSSIAEKFCFFSTIEFVNACEQEKAKGKAGQIAETLIRKPYSEVAHFSVKKPAHFCMETITTGNNSCRAQRIVNHKRL